MMTRFLILMIGCSFSLSLRAESHFSEALNKKQHSNVIIFVSFSMPKQSLIAYLSDAKKIQASVVIRGLVNHSFKETFSRVSDIVKESGGGVELNPPLFKKFNIQAVPAVAILPNDSPCIASALCSEGNFDVVSGDIPLAAALKEIRDKGEISQQNAAESFFQLKEAAHA